VFVFPEYVLLYGLQFCCRSGLSVSLIVFSYSCHPVIVGGNMGHQKNSIVCLSM